MNEIDHKIRNEIATIYQPKKPIEGTTTNKIPHKNRCKSIRGYFRDYCENSSIIGFKYLGEKRSRGERILWFFLILIAMTLSVYYIMEIYKKYRENPFIVNLATRESPIFIIPFPAVTICPVVKTRRDLYNYTRTVHKIISEDDNLTQDELTDTQFMSSVCEDKNQEMRIKLPGNKIFTEEFYDRLDSFSIARASNPRFVTTKFNNGGIRWAQFIE
ncbi:hypothetical protein JTB14_037311 [Gonioctena quinquepunctata]|nr:hypothetical protein JTB14_037311 [Gonioctena quinquepunctata]